MPLPAQQEFDADLLDLCRCTTVVAASERLAHALRLGFDQSNASGGRSVWRSPKIRSWHEFLRQCFGQLLENGHTDAYYLDDSLQRLAWLEHVPSNCEVDPDVLYDQIATAWNLCHDWQLLDRLDEFADNDNQRLFRDWSRRYRRAAQRHRWVTAAELCQLVSRFDAAAWWSDVPLTLVGFDVIPPNVSGLVESLRGAGVRVEFYAPVPRAPAHPQLVSSDDPEQEMSDAVRWAREVMSTTTAARIGIVVPDLATRYDQVVRQLDAILQPAEREPDPARSPYDISGGTPLAAIPVVSDALALLSWMVRPAHYLRVAALLESPVLQLDASAAVAHDARLPEHYDALTLTRHVRTTALRRVVSRARRVHTMTLHRWLSLFRSLLADAGWPNLAGLDSESYQACRRFERLLETLTTSRIATTSMSYEVALARLQGAARREVFAPQRPPATLQVLGYLESAHLRFTHLWVCGLNDTSWPSPPQPNPFIPLRLLRRAGVPRIDAPSELEFARHMIATWRRAAPRVTFSHTRSTAEVSQRPSPLIGPTASSAVATGSGDRRHPQLRRAAEVLEVRDEDRGVALDIAAFHHRGSGVLRDQSACPFRAYARYRLGLRAAAAPHTFPDAAERGTLVHDALRRYFESVIAHPSDAVEASRIDSAVVAALAQRSDWPEPFCSNERRRVTRLLEQWLAYEGERMPGRAIAVEQTAGLTLGGLQFDLRIDRINAIGRHGKVVIDYKTGDTNPQSMLGPRPREPQLAMYALALDGTQAVLCAQVVENACRIMGWKSPAPDLADASPLRTPPVDVAAHWQGLLDVWRVDLTRLADEYRRGFAAVAPRDVDACRECDLQPVCRIRARRQFAADA